MPDGSRQREAGAYFDNTPRFLGGKILGQKHPGLSFQDRIFSQAAEERAGSLRDDRPGTALVQAHVTAGTPPRSARPHGSAARAPVDPDRHAVGLIEHQL